MENLYTEEQVRELLRQQRKECVFEYELRGTESKAQGHILNAPEPQFPTPHPGNSCREG